MTAIRPQNRRVRTLFLSDIHLGTKGCQAELFLDFLRLHDADTIYLVDDIADEVDRVGVVKSQKVEKELGLTALGAKMDVGQEQCPDTAILGAYGSHAPSKQKHISLL